VVIDRQVLVCFCQFYDVIVYSSSMCLVWAEWARQCS